MSAKSARAWLKSHPEVRRVKRKAYLLRHKSSVLGKISTQTRQLRWRLKLKLQALARYGGPSCACCGEERIEYLDLDHIHNNGSEERKLARTKGGYAFYLWLKKKGWPDGYQVMCTPCNRSKGRKDRCRLIHPLKLVWDTTMLTNIEAN
jgi:hypothetical protein